MSSERKTSKVTSLLGSSVQTGHSVTAKGIEYHLLFHQFTI